MILTYFETQHYLQDTFLQNKFAICECPHPREVTTAFKRNGCQHLARVPVSLAAYEYPWLLMSPQTYKL